MAREGARVPWIFSSVSEPRRTQATVSRERAGQSGLGCPSPPCLSDIAWRGGRSRRGPLAWPECRVGGSVDRWPALLGRRPESFPGAHSAHLLDVSPKDGVRCHADQLEEPFSTWGPPASAERFCLDAVNGPGKLLDLPFPCFLGVGLRFRAMSALRRSRTQTITAAPAKFCLVL